jgi:hypothetical protein
MACPWLPEWQLQARKGRFARGDSRPQPQSECPIKA